MRILCQHIAMRANQEDGEVGRFFQSRFRAVRLLDEQAILACAANVDLNPIRAAMAESLEASKHTSVQRHELNTATTFSRNCSFIRHRFISGAPCFDANRLIVSTSLNVAISALDLNAAENLFSLLTSGPVFGGPSYGLKSVRD
jgi:hypothetical protein